MSGKPHAEKFPLLQCFLVENATSRDVDRVAKNPIVGTHFKSCILCYNEASSKLFLNARSVTGLPGSYLSVQYMK